MSEPPAPRPAPGEGEPPDARVQWQEFAGSPRVVRSESLLAGASQCAILHNQTIYFLRQTRFGKLILTK